MGLTICISKVPGAAAAAAAAGPWTTPEMAKDSGGREAGCCREFLLGRVRS